MSVAIYPGSFDPITLGHLDIINRASKIFDQLIIGVLNNSAKTPLFLAEERVNMLEGATKHLDNITVECFDGLLIDFVKAKNTNIIVRGLRALSDFDLELQMAQSNRVIAPEIDTVFLSTCLEYSYLSSSAVKEYAKHGVSVKEFVPENVIEQLQNKFN